MFYYTTTVGSVSEIDKVDVQCHSEVDAVPRILLGKSCYHATITVAVRLVSIVAVTSREIVTTHELTTHERRTIDGHVYVMTWVRCTVKHNTHLS